jgi:hypothetical protein
MLLINENFLWPVPASVDWHWGVPSPCGIEEIDKKRSRTQVLVAHGANKTEYAPLREATGLFRNFAATEPTPEGIRRFALQYGMLGEPHSATFSLDNGSATGENLYAWTSEISAMSSTVALWYLVHTADVRGLSKIIKWISPSHVAIEGLANMDLMTAYHAGAHPPDRAIVFDQSRLVERAADGSFPGFVLADIATGSSPLLKRFKEGDLIEPALHCIQVILQGRLREYGVSLALTRGPGTRLLELSVDLDSLVGVLWLQFAMAVDGDRSYRQCQDCRAWYAVSGHAGRPDKMYCSASCRASAHRKKQAEARRLHQEGMTAKAIAKQLGAEIKTVKGWISR